MMMPSTSDNDSRAAHIALVPTADEPVVYPLPDFNVDLHVLAAATQSSAKAIVDLSTLVKPDDFELPTDSSLFIGQVTLAKRGTDPIPVALHGYLEAEGMFGGPVGGRRAARMREIATCMALPEQLPTLAVDLLEKSFTRTMAAHGAGVIQAATELPYRERMPYLVDGGRRLRDIDARRAELVSKIGGSE